MSTPASSSSGASRAGRVSEVLATAVTGLGGQPREGQQAMAAAVADAMRSGTHLLVQAGTGTGKSLAYLVPAMLHRKRVVVATATLALQHQLVDRDLPRLVEAVRGERGVDASFAVLKGRSNYACLHRVREGVPDEQGVLVDVPAGPVGEEVVALREWVEEQAEEGGPGDKDHAPRHTDRAWRQISVSARECLGATRCPFGEECFAEAAKAKAAESQLVVTNHSLLAIDAIEGIPMLPEYDAVVVDEAHELVARVTQAATDELTASEVERASRRASKHVADADNGLGSPADDLGDAAETLRAVMTDTEGGRIDRMGEALADALEQVRDAARACVSAMSKDRSGGGGGGGGEEADAGRAQAKAAVQEVFATAERMAAHSDADVLWLSRPFGTGRERIPDRLCIAPLQVWGPMRDRMLKESTVVFTSATLRLGGDFGVVAATLGLKPTEQVPDGDAAASLREGEDDDVLPWRGLDVGSPFDYARQGILYIARRLPPPGRDGLAEAQLAEIVRLVDAAGGRTLGLFSSRRAAESAAEAVRERLPHLTTLAQGDAQLSELTRLFVEDPHTNLFGTLGLWQGIDVPGETCQLVIIDRIPFPRPDDPLMSARQKAADAAGGNGFMQIAATHAALLMAQGAGRLIRSTADRGVVAVLDPRLVTARYGRFIDASLPPMWRTTDQDVVAAALGRLAGDA